MLKYYYHHGIIRLHTSEFQLSFRYELLVSQHAKVILLVINWWKHDGIETLGAALGHHFHQRISDKQNRHTTEKTYRLQSANWFLGRSDIGKTALWRQQIDSVRCNYIIENTTKLSPSIHILAWLRTLAENTHIKRDIGEQKSNKASAGSLLILSPSHQFLSESVEREQLVHFRE